ncbi:MAG TPA: outer membrane lipid asymmetry maintenance protein MlaD [Candidatus Binataceae bacterium]|nr:outer membrane lipid asymmetry maintenance protein MlaD [Candidatus Binataceae bacterium]
MYASRTTQFIVGIFGLLGIVAIVILSVRLGNLSLFPPPGYMVHANFDNIAGLKTNDLVEIAGVQVGKVTEIKLTQNGVRARVTLRIREGVQIDTDAIASIKTSGLLGDKYVAIALGAGEKNIADGGTIRKTEPAFVLEDAIGNVINRLGTGTSKDSKDEGSGNGSK